MKGILGYIVLFAGFLTAVLLAEMKMKREKKTTQEGVIEWSVSGEAGAVNFLVYPPSGAIDLHSSVIGLHGKRRRRGATPNNNCDILGRCYYSMDFPHADLLWKDCQHGRDEDRIWRELENWYTRTFTQEKGTR